MGDTDVFVLIDRKSRRHLASFAGPVAKVPDLGVLNLDTVRAHIGRKFEIGGTSVLVLPASRRDRMEGLARRAQSIGPKDAASILFNAAVGPGDTVVEAGAGSGWLTVALASAVGPSGTVVVYERRADFAAFASENVRRAGLNERVTMRVADIVDGIAERDVSATILDIPEPWTAVRACWDALRVGGGFASFSPTAEQVASTVIALRALPFAETRTVEIIERNIEVRDGGTHPSFAPLGHTGYLTFARKALERF